MSTKPVPPDSIPLHQVRSSPPKQDLSSSANARGEDSASEVRIPKPAAPDTDITLTSTRHGKPQLAAPETSVTTTKGKDADKNGSAQLRISSVENSMVILMGVVKTVKNPLANIVLVGKSPSNIEQCCPAVLLDAVLASRQFYINMRLSINNGPMKAVNQLSKTSVSMGFLAFGKLHRDDFLSAFSPNMTWDVDQQFGGWRDDDQSKRMTSIALEEIWDLYWLPLIRNDWVRLGEISSLTSDGAPISMEWNVIGYTKLPHESSDRMAYKTHIQDQYFILPNGRLVMSARIWRTVTVPLPNHYVSIIRPRDGGLWTSAGEQVQPRRTIFFINLITWFLKLRRWMAPIVAIAAIAASVQNLGISGSAGIILGALGLFTAIWSLLIIVAEYTKDIITYLHGSSVKAWVRHYNATLNSQLV